MPCGFERDGVDVLFCPQASKHINHWGDGASGGPPMTFFFDGQTLKTLEGFSWFRVRGVFGPPAVSR